jgi:DNA-directed RNA polymerase subunit RPC12/RpoP
MVYQARRAVSSEMEDTIYACRRCGTELVRTSVRAAGQKKAAAA